MRTRIEPGKREEPTEDEGQVGRIVYYIRETAHIAAGERSADGAGRVDSNDVKTEKAYLGAGHHFGGRLFFRHSLRACGRGDVKGLLRGAVAQ